MHFDLYWSSPLLANIVLSIFFLAPLEDNNNNNNNNNNDDDDDGDNNNNGGQPGKYWSFARNCKRPPESLETIRWLVAI